MKLTMGCHWARYLVNVSCFVCRVSVVFPVSNVQHLVRVSSSRVEPPVASHARPRLGKAIGEMARFCQRPARRRFDRCFGAFAKQFACQTRRPRPGLGCRRHGAGYRHTAGSLPNPKAALFLRIAANPPPGQASASASLWSNSSPGTCVFPCGAHSTRPDGRRWGRGALGQPWCRSKSRCCMPRTGPRRRRRLEIWHET
jgi:hypothetical protein